MRIRTAHRVGALHFAPILAILFQVSGLVHAQVANDVPVPAPSPTSGPCPPSLIPEDVLITPIPFTKTITSGSIDPGEYPERDVSSPYSDGAGLTILHDSLNPFIVDMPSSTSESWTLAINGDFYGVATLCEYRDHVTGQYYDIGSISLTWAADSGGGYAVRYGYTPYTPGVGPSSPTLVTTLYGIDAASGYDTRCLGGASEEHTPYTRDLVLSPQSYVDSGDLYTAYERGAYNPWTGVTTIQDMINGINARFTALGRKITVVLISHGLNDQWLDPNGGVQLQANNANVTALGAGVIGHVSRVYFESCCTSKGYVYGDTPNVVASLSDAMTAVGDPYTQVCGWRHFTWSWFRGGAFHVGHTRTDSLTCGTGP